MAVFGWRLSAFTAVTLGLFFTTVFGEVITADECGFTKGCFRVPTGCTDSSNCQFFLTWKKNDSDTISFEYFAQFTTTSLPWAGFGLNSKRQMSGTSVVDCIVNGSSSNQVAIQMSYNTGHTNSPLNHKHLGLVDSSLRGSLINNQIVCEFTRLRVIKEPDVESGKVKNLTSPYYVIFATGPTDGAGNKQYHDYKIASKIHIDFNKYTNSGETWMKSLYRAHVTMMIVAWMVLASLAMFTSRYMKNQWKESGAFCGKPIWFQVHRFLMGLVLTMTAVGIILIFAHKNWEFIHPDAEQDPPSVHPVLGITLGCLLVLNVLVGLVRPNLYSPYRRLFVWFHGIIGHGAHLLAAVTMYFGVMQEEANMPDWSRWIVVGFASWRVIIDVVLTCTRLHCKDAAADYVALANNEVDEAGNKTSAWKCSVMIVYMIVVIILATTLIILANVSA